MSAAPHPAARPVPVRPSDEAAGPDRDARLASALTPNAAFKGGGAVADRVAATVDHATTDAATCEETGVAEGMVFTTGVSDLRTPAELADPHD